jgi:hypothetical protein
MEEPVSRCGDRNLRKCIVLVLETPSEDSVCEEIYEPTNALNKIQFMISVKYYMFRHLSVILRESTWTKEQNSSTIIRVGLCVRLSR